jgi:uncharacterized alkaline shock family protein YloU
MPRRPIAGRSAVTRRAITDIVRSSVRGSYGVVGFASTGLGDRVRRALGLREPGIRLALDDGLRIDLHLRVAYGLPVAEVARQVDSAVRYALRHDLGRDDVELTVHIDGLEYRPGRIPKVPVAEPGPSEHDGATRDGGPAGTSRDVAPARPGDDPATEVGGAA